MLADYVGFLKQGRLQLSERLVDLRARFRRVEVTASGDGGTGDHPPEWMQWEQTDGVVRFVDSRFDPSETPRRLHQRFGEQARWQAEELSLREIFLALDRPLRTEDRRA